MLVLMFARRLRRVTMAVFIDVSVVESRRSRVEGVGEQLGTKSVCMDQEIIYGWFRRSYHGFF